MNDKEIQNLQRYIGNRSKGQTDSEVVARIEKISSKHNITSDEWEKLLFPACANCDVEMLEYVLQHLVTLSNPKEYIIHTLRFRNIAQECEQKQTFIIERLFSYVSPEERQQSLNEALSMAAWFGEYESVKYLIGQGADLFYQSNGRSILELSKNAVTKFGDNRVEKFILSIE